MENYPDLPIDGRLRRISNYIYISMTNRILTLINEQIDFKSRERQLAVRMEFDSKSQNLWTIWDRVAYSALRSSDEAMRR